MALLFRFVEENASLEELIMVVVVLKSLRFWDSILMGNL